METRSHLQLASTKGFSVERLRAFLAVAEARGIAKAAPREPVRQSQLSRQVKELEVALGLPLFDRAGRRMVPTPAGERLLRVVRDLFAGLSEVAASGGPVRAELGAGDSVLRWVLLPALGRLHHEHSDVVVGLTALSSEAVAVGLIEHRLDLGILRTVPAASGLRSVRLGKMEYALFVARKRWRKGASPWGLVVRDVPLVVPRGEPGLGPALEVLGSASLHCETFPQVADAVRSGDFVGVLPRLAARELPPSQFHCFGAAPLDAVASVLILAWRPSQDDLKPRLTSMRGALGLLLRDALAAVGQPAH